MKPAHLLAPAFALSLFVPATARAHTVEADMAAAARGFLATLSPEQTAKASFKFEDAERKNWHFIPAQGWASPSRRCSPTSGLWHRRCSPPASAPEAMEKHWA